MIETPAFAFAQLLPFVTFAFVASITPGPSNLLILGNSVRYGFAAALPIVCGACAGSAALVLFVGFGAGAWLAAHPGVQTVMGWAGTLWLSYLAWQIACKPPADIRTAADRPTGGWMAAALQIANPKSWSMALAVVSVFAGANADLPRYAFLSAVFLMVSAPCLTIWAVLGSRAGGRLRSATSAKALNVILGAALFASAWAGLLEHVRM
ncbi:LysE family translocator [Consotaella salsifontis]|uniref:Threonine/homoserine/homoserine lactone efflux protein n=1 Tax=Consotaella salsifontis TaxID=1365950 RepID=A0A1T4T1Y2_9HYPH|nr:LysE family translocator [Consotaella salsifontis]SKA34520.1 Threonine/homoserine/homoserine lactone efflux protein [Consotaella salsifontis]